MITIFLDDDGELISVLFDGQLAVKPTNLKLPLNKTKSIKVVLESRGPGVPPQRCTTVGGVQLCLPPA